MARRYAVTTASRAAGQKSQYWANTQNGEVVHDATSTLDPVRSSFQRSRVRTRVVHYSTTTRLVRTTTRAPAARCFSRACAHSPATCRQCTHARHWLRQPRGDDAVQDAQFPPPDPGEPPSF